MGCEPCAVWLGGLLGDFIELFRSVKTSLALWSYSPGFKSHHFWYATNDLWYATNGSAVLILLYHGNSFFCAKVSAKCPNFVCWYWKSQKFLPWIIASSSWRTVLIAPCSCVQSTLLNSTAFLFCYVDCGRKRAFCHSKTYPITWFMWC